MLDIYFLSPAANKHAEELRAGRKLIGAFELGHYTAYAVETNALHGHFYLDGDRYVISRAIRENYSHALVNLERALMNKLVPHYNTGDLGFTISCCDFMVHTSPLSARPVLFLEYQIICPDFYHNIF